MSQFQANIMSKDSERPRLKIRKRRVIGDGKKFGCFLAPIYGLSSYQLNIAFITDSGT